MWLESFQSLDIENDIALSIWSCELKIMANKKVRSQIANLTLDHWNWKTWI
jgi:hypothetical protein